MIVTDWSQYLPYFREHEFKCKCGCGLADMQKSFMDMLLSARKIAGRPFVINSGCRCPEHNKNVGGTDRSDHLTGHGADIEVGSGRNRWIIEDALIKVGFIRIGHGQEFIHAGNRPGNPVWVKWVY